MPSASVAMSARTGTSVPPDASQPFDAPERWPRAVQSIATMVAPASTSARASSKEGRDENAPVLLDALLYAHNRHVHGRADRPDILRAIGANSGRASIDRGTCETRHRASVVGTRRPPMPGRKRSGGRALREKAGIHDAPRRLETAQRTIAASKTRMPPRMRAAAGPGAPRHSPSSRPMELATSRPTARLSGHPMEGPISPSSGVAAPYRKMLPPQARPSGSPAPRSAPGPRPRTAASSNYGA